MVKPSFIPERAIRELDLTRRRRQLVGERARERNRIQKKILEDANVKLGDVLVTCSDSRGD